MKLSFIDKPIFYTRFFEFKYNLSKKYPIRVAMTLNNLNRQESNAITILYVEDNLKSRTLTTTILQQLCKNVVVAVDGEDGFNKFKNSQVDLIITNMNMPKLNGIELMKKIREINQDVFILILSAYDGRDYLIESIKYGVEEYLLKPLNRKQLMTAIDKVSQKVEKKNRTKKQTNLLQQYQSIVDKSYIISKADVRGKITYVNDEFCRISGYHRYELLGKSHSIVRSPDESPLIFEQMWKTINSKKIWQGVIKNRAKNGELYYVKATIKPILNVSGEIEEFIASRMLVTDIIHPQQQIIDFIQSIEEPLVILIKIDDFQYLDGFHHRDLNDAMQRDFAIKLFNLIPKECSFSKIYLLDNGEFAIAKDKKTCSNIDNIIKEMKKFQKQVNESKINMGYIDYDLSVIVSLAYGNDALEDAKLGLKQLLESKQDFIMANGLVKKNQTFFSSKIETFKMLKRAIASYNIVSYFQPIINNKTQKIEKYESLVRLIDKDKNILSPYLFLDISKKGKYYAQITSIVLENSFNALRETDMTISINLSALDIEKEETKEQVLMLLEQNKTHAHRIVLELLEDENIKNFQTIKNFIAEVKYYGVRIAIDDFGVGYSNFERVLDYKPDILKIDGRLIKNINEDSVSYSMVESIVSFAKKEKLQTIAEYVESEAIYNVLCRLGVDYSQGYYFGKPALLNMKV